MKLLIFLLLLFTACEKEGFDCKTCDENVHLVKDGAIVQDYIQSSTVYCDGNWRNVDGKVTVQKHLTVSDPGWWKKTTTVICHD